MDIDKSMELFLKVGKLVRALFPSEGESTITCIASELSNILRLRANPDTSSIRISDKPLKYILWILIFLPVCVVRIHVDSNFMTILKNTQIAYLTEGDVLVGRAYFITKFMSLKIFRIQKF